MASRTYAAFQSVGPGAGTAWDLEPFPPGTPPSVVLFDGSDGTYYYWSRVSPPGGGVKHDDDGSRSFRIADDDDAIPDASVINSVQPEYRVNGGGAATYPYQARSGLGTVFGSKLALVAGFNLYTPSFATDVQGNPFTKESLFDTGYGLYCSWAETGADGRFMHWARLRLIVNFTLPEPTAVTVAADEIAAAEAQLNGTLNPNSANASYPVSYQFEWGTAEDALDQSTTLVGGQTGSADIAVSETITGLLPGTTYYYRLKVLNADHTVVGETLSFSTLTSSIRLNEFRRQASGTITKEARTLLLNFEFTQQQPHPNCDPEEEVQDPPFEV